METMTSGRRRQLALTMMRNALAAIDDDRSPNGATAAKFWIRRATMILRQARADRADPRERQLLDALLVIAGRELQRRADRLASDGRLCRSGKERGPN